MKEVCIIVAMLKEADAMLIVGRIDEDKEKPQDIVDKG